MALERTVEKLDDYFERLNAGKAQKIEPSHVDKVIKKLIAKEQQWQEELAETEKTSKKERLERKLALVHEQLERANWLKSQISEL